MNLVRFHEPVMLSFRKSAGGAASTLDAHRDFVLCDGQIDRVMLEPHLRDRVYKVSKLDNMIPHFNVNTPKKPGVNRILVYNGSGGYGDQIMTWPLTLILHKMGYEVHLLADPGNQICWWHMPWIASIQNLPIQAGIFWMFDHFLLMDTVCNVLEHPNHPHPLDLMLGKIGIDPESIDPALKVVRPQFTAQELGSTMSYRERQLAFYQLGGANKVRNLPPQDSVFIFSKLSEAFPQFTWLVAYDEFIDKDYINFMLEPDIDPTTKEQRKNDKGELLRKVKFPNAILHFSPNLRELWALISQSQVVVAPDSMLVHAAGCLGVPCVGLWGPYEPRSRVKYYQNHYPIFNKAACPHAPCSHYLPTYPKYCPPRKDRNVCEVLAAISPQQIIDGIHRLVPDSKLAPPKL